MASESDRQPLQDSSENLKKRKSSDGCCSGFCCAKTFCILYGFFFFVVGLILLGFGFYVYASYGYKGINDSLFVPSILAILVGAFTVATAFCGIIGAIKEKPILLKIFLGIVVVMFIILLITGIIAYVYRERTMDVLGEQLENAVIHYGEDAVLTKAVDTTQRRLKCCGLKGMEDWDKNKKMDCVNYESDIFCSVPSSCCPADMEKENEECGVKSRLHFTRSVLIEKGFHGEGCSQKLHKWFENHLDAVGIAALACAMLHVIGMLILYIFITMVDDRLRLYKYYPWMKSENS